MELRDVSIARHGFYLKLYKRFGVAMKTVGVPQPVEE